MGVNFVTVFKIELYTLIRWVGGYNVATESQVTDRLSKANVLSEECCELLQGFARSFAAGDDPSSVEMSGRSVDDVYRRLDGFGP